MNALPLVPVTEVALVIVGGATRIVRAKFAVPVPFPLTALRVTLVVPTALGVPLISPVLVLTLKPVGNPVAPKLVGLLVAVIW